MNFRNMECVLQILVDEIGNSWQKLQRGRLIKMLELRERNGKKHIVSNDELKAFAWAGYYTQCSDILINGKEYKVVHVTDSAIDFNDGTSFPVGCYAIFEGEDGVRICDDYNLREIRNSNPLESNIYCFDDETFLKVA